jgi:hypothetical protein
MQILELFAFTPKNLNKFSAFYLPHMEYEGSIGFVMRKIKRVQEVSFSKEKCCRIYPRMKFLEQNLDF